MKITRDNYESFFLDYLEGRLEEELAGELHGFLNRHPDLKEELQEYEEVTLGAPEVVFAGKGSLLREKYDQPGVFDHAAAARLEGDLSPEEAVEFGDYLRRHPEKKREADLFELTRLTPDSTLLFPGKEKLFRQPAIRRLREWTMRIAAILLLALLIYTLTDQPGPLPEAGDDSPELAGTVTPSQELTITPPETTAESPTEITGTGHTAAAPRQTAYNTAKPSATRTIDPENGGRASTPAFSLQNEGRDTPPVTLTAATDPGMKKIPALMASLEGEISTLPTLMTAPLSHPAITDITAGITPEEEDAIPLNERILEKAGLHRISLAFLARKGLDLASSLTGEKINYDTDDEGQIIAFNVDTRLLGLSIPVGQ